MPRPVGRYFEKIIKQLQALKKEESIIINEQFKTDLRKELMVKISQMKAEKTEKTSFWEKLAGFKMHFAAVPMVLMVVVTVYGISRLPISLNNNELKTETPKSDKTLKNQTEQEKAENYEEIKTFSGVSVLPSWYLKKESQDQESTENNSAKNNVNLFPVKPNSSHQILSPQPESFSPNINNNDDQNVGGYTENTAVLPAVPAPVPSIQNNQALDNTNQNNQQQGSEPDATNSSRIVEGSNLPEDVDTSNNSSPQANEPIELNNNNDATQPKTEEKPALTAPTSPSYMMIAPSTDTDITPYIYYRGEFSEEDKSFFKKEIKSKIGTKSLDFATVSLINEGEASTLIYFNDSSKASYNYLLNPETKTWQLKTRGYINLP